MFCYILKRQLNTFNSNQLLYLKFFLNYISNFKNFEKTIECELTKDKYLK